MYEISAHRKGINAMSRNDENNYTLRPLTIDDAEEYNALLRYAFQVTEQELAETGWKDDEITQSKFPVLQRADVLGCFNGDDLIAQFAVYPLDMNIYGVKYSVGFVTSVCTYPEYTGHGIMKRLMIQSLIRMRDAHKSFALLYPYSIPLYRGLGWEIISNKMTYTIKDTQIPRKLNEPGYVRRVSWDDKEFKELHTKFAEKTHGCLYRNNLAWEEYWRWDEDDTSVAIYYSKDDVPYGYMVYMISSDVMHVKEMIYLNREAQLGLWEFIHAHDSMIDEVRGNNYYSEPIAFELDDSDIKETIRSEPEHIAAWFDTNKIDKILYNLLSNATKFSYQDGRGKIEILLKAEDQESEFQYKTLLIKIRNIGKGIATDELPYIFNRFYENSFKQLGLKGNGIGLALTKSLVELHKGTISVTSELEEWTEFTIRIPINKTSYSNEQINETIEHRFIVNDSPEGAAIQQSQSNSEIQKSSKQNSVLVIEDDQDLRDSLQRLLQEKYTISMAANGEEGLKLVQEIKPDLILSDVMMPIMDGFELCKQLKRKKETSCIPIILLTAKINDKDYLEGLNCGADAY